MNTRMLAKRVFFGINKALGRRNVYVDCGANCGQVLRSAIESLPEFEFHAFEPLKEHQDSLFKVRDAFPHRSISIRPEAIWTTNEVLPFYLSSQNSLGATALDGSTLMTGKQAVHPMSGVVDYGNPVNVQGIDFSEWITSNFRKTDHIIVKMDIEGAEYPVLRRLLDSGAIDFLNKIMVEFHLESHGQERLTSVSRGEHDRLITDLKKRVRLVMWH